MKLLLRKEQVKKLFHSFSVVSKVQISLFDREGVSLITEDSLPDEYNKMSPLCVCLREIDNFRKKCAQCDINAFDLISRDLTSYTYVCHAGLRETLIPVLHDDMLIGYLMFGQYLLKEDNDLDLNRFLNYTDDIELLTENYKHIIRISKKEEEALLDILNAYAVYLSSKNLVIAHTEEKFALIKDFINDNITEKLTSKTICCSLGFSKSMIYKVVAENTGMSLGDYIATHRIELAKNLLVNTQLSVGEIAFKVGICDYSYFTKVYSKVTGLTPSEYRKQFKNHAK